jgi:hypothetical protein
MAKKGYISETMNGGRIVSHGKITDYRLVTRLQAP